MFDLGENPRETEQHLNEYRAVAARLRNATVRQLKARGGTEYLESGSLKEVPFQRIEMGRYGGETYPTSPADAPEPEDD